MENDSDKHITELRRQQAEPVKRLVLTPEEVRSMTFSTPPAGKRGYNEDEVDVFLDRVDAALRNASKNILTPEDVGNMAFSKPPLGKRGYNADEVDAFLHRVEHEMGVSQQVQTRGLSSSRLRR